MIHLGRHCPSKGGHQRLEHFAGPTPRAPLLTVRPHRSGVQPVGDGAAAGGATDSRRQPGEGADGAEGSTGAGRGRMAELRGNARWSWVFDKKMIT